MSGARDDWPLVERWTAADLERVRKAFRAETGAAPPSWETAVAAAVAGTPDPLYNAGVLEALAHSQWRRGGGRFSHEALAISPDHAEGAKHPAESVIAMGMQPPSAARPPRLRIVGPNARGLDWADLAGREPPARPWIVEGLVPSRATTLLAGAGGSGKSLLTQQLVTAVAAGQPFLGLDLGNAAAADDLPGVPALMLACEDEADELWRRQVDICRAQGLCMEELEAHGCHIWPRAGLSNMLGSFDEARRFLPGDLFNEVREFALAYGVRLIVLDNLAHLFPGLEVDRGQVTSFVAACTRLALDIDGAVILVGHPAKVEGSQFSGSTAWEAAVRQRLYLSRERDADGEEVEGGDIRALSANKVNYGPKGGAVEMQWRSGAFHEVQAGETPLAEDHAERVFLECLDAMTARGVMVSYSPSKAYAPLKFCELSAGRRVGRKALERAMARLLERGAIVPKALLWRDLANRRNVYGMARANPEGSAQTAQTPRGDAAQTVCANGAQTRKLPRDEAAQTVRANPPFLKEGDRGGIQAPPLSFQP